MLTYGRPGACRSRARCRGPRGLRPLQPSIEELAAPILEEQEQEQHEARAAPCVEELASPEGEAPRVPYSPASTSLPSISSKSKSRARPASPLQPGVEEVAAPAASTASRRRARPPRPLQPCVEQARSDAPASEQEMEQGKATVCAMGEKREDWGENR